MSESSFALEANNLTKVYSSSFGGSGVTALDDFSLQIKRGSVFGLLGPNGAGKTTLVKIILGLVHATSGTALINGVNIKHHRARSVIGFLPENHRFPPFLTGEQLLLHYGRLSGLDAATINGRIPHLLEQVNMSRWAKTRIKQYSKGMMQRIGLAQALVNDPDIVLLDEPTDGVDPVGRREIRGILQRLRNDGKTIFLNSHLLSEVEQVCTEVVILDKGKLMTQGSISDLTTSSSSAYRITVFGQPSTQTAIDALGAILETGPAGQATYAATVGDRNELNMLIDQLRADDVLIESVVATRRTLEDSFIDLLDKPRNDG